MTRQREWKLTGLVSAHEWMLLHRAVSTIGNLYVLPTSGNPPHPALFSFTVGKIAGKPFSQRECENLEMFVRGVCVALDIKPV